MPKDTLNRKHIQPLNMSLDQAVVTVSRQRQMPRHHADRRNGIVDTLQMENFHTLMPRRC